MEKAYFQMRMLFILAALVGLFLLPQINLQLNPSPRVQKLSVNFQYPGAGPQEVERQVTSIIESVLSRLEYLTEITSTSSVGSGNISLSFSRKADMNDVRLNVSVLIRQIYDSLPEGVSYPSVSYQSKFETKPSLLSYAVVSDHSGNELEDILRQKIIIPLARIQGVSNIELRGLQKNECQVIFHSGLLEDLGIEYREISQAVSNYMQKSYLGTVHTDNGVRISINMGNQEIEKDAIAELKSIPVANLSGRTLLLGEVAHVKIAPEKEKTYYRINGQRSTNMTLYADEDVNFIKLAATCKNKLHSLESTLPPGIDMLLEYDRSAYLSSELQTIGIRMLAAMLILLISMIIIYRHALKIMAVWSGFIITLLISVIAYYFAGLELHLYSLAGLTLSLGIVLDNLIVCTDHVFKYRNLKIFIALLAASLTTIGALSIIFFISPQYREQLTDFAWIFIINILVSLAVSLFYIPAVISHKDTTRLSLVRRRRMVRYNRSYLRFCRLLTRQRWIPVTVLILAFGIPLFLLPLKLEKNKFQSERYNKIMEGWYGKDVHPVLSKYLGGTLRLFTRKKDGFFFAQTERQETRLYVRASVPFGGTTEQLNNIIRDFEEYLMGFEQVKQINSYVSGPSSSSITIQFHQDYADGGFPYQLKSLLENKAAETGSGDFQVYGVGRGFSNVLRGEGLSSHLKLLGYNYDQLLEVAQKGSQELMKQRRIKKVYINPTRNYFAPDDRYYYLELAKIILNEHPEIDRQDIFSNWQNLNPDKGVIEQVQKEGLSLPVRLVSTEKDRNNIWKATYDLHAIDSAQYIRNDKFSKLDVHHGENKIVRYNQQYQLYLEYDFIGNYRLANIVKEEMIENIKKWLPAGYHISDDRSGGWWRRPEEKMTYIILSSLVVIFLISTILFNSLRQALIPLLLVPVSFIGVFLTVYFFDFRFDQGGFAAFLLVAGLSVNAGIFIINDYNNYRKVQRLTPARAYLKAFQAKIVPIILTVVSTVLGLLPFLLFEKNEPFWYSLAICTIAGLVFSIIGVVVFLPLGIKNLRHD